MNYKLAKQLKEAGFPEVECDCKATESNPEGICRYMGSDKLCHTPTLSEIIKACGNDFESLNIVKKEMPFRKTISWRAYPTEEAYFSKIGGDCEVDCCGYETGETPEDAVAKLWLKLNKI